MLVDLTLYDFTRLHKVAIGALIRPVAAPHLLGHGGAEGGAGHTAEEAVREDVPDGSGGVVLRLGRANAALLLKIRVLAVGVAVKDGAGRGQASLFGVLDVQQHGLLGAGVVALFVAEVELAVGLAAAHHQHAAGDVPQVGAVGQAAAAGHALTLVGVHGHQRGAAVPDVEGLQGRHDAAHLVAAAHFEVGRQKALQRVHDHQQRRDVRHKGFQRAVFEAEQMPGAQKILVSRDHEHPAHVGPGGQIAGFEHLAGVVLAGEHQHFAGLRRRDREESRRPAGGDVSHQLGRPQTFAGAAVGTQQGDLAQRHKSGHQPAGLLQGGVLQTGGGRGTPHVPVVPGHGVLKERGRVLLGTPGAACPPGVHMAPLQAGAGSRDHVLQALEAVQLLVRVAADVDELVSIIVQQLGGGRLRQILQKRLEAGGAVVLTHGGHLPFGPAQRAGK